jgi:hypothetical protein
LRQLGQIGALEMCCGSALHVEFPPACRTWPWGSDLIYLVRLAMPLPLSQACSADSVTSYQISIREDVVCLQVLPSACHPTLGSIPSALLCTPLPTYPCILTSPHLSYLSVSSLASNSAASAVNFLGPSPRLQYILGSFLPPAPSTESYNPLEHCYPASRPSPRRHDSHPFATPSARRSNSSQVPHALSQAKCPTRRRSPLPPRLRSPSR